jgi:hypothetical protein
LQPTIAGCWMGAAIYIGALSAGHGRPLWGPAFVTYPRITTVPAIAYVRSTHCCSSTTTEPSWHTWQDPARFRGRIPARPTRSAGPCRAQRHKGLSERDRVATAVRLGTTGARRCVRLPRCDRGTGPLVESRGGRNAFAERSKYRRQRDRAGHEEVWNSGDGCRCYG